MDSRLLGVCLKNQLKNETIDEVLQAWSREESKWTTLGDVKSDAWVMLLYIRMILPVVLDRFGEFVDEICRQTAR